MDSKHKRGHKADNRSAAAMQRSQSLNHLRKKAQNNRPNLKFPNSPSMANYHSNTPINHTGHSVNPLQTNLATPTHSQHQLKAYQYKNQKNPKTSEMRSPMKLVRSPSAAALGSKRHQATPQQQLNYTQQTIGTEATTPSRRMALNKRTGSVRNLSSGFRSHSGTPNTANNEFLQSRITVKNVGIGGSMTPTGGPGGFGNTPGGHDEGGGGLASNKNILNQNFLRKKSSQKNFKKLALNSNKKGYGYNLRSSMIRKKATGMVSPVGGQFSGQNSQKGFFGNSRNRPRNEVNLRQELARGSSRSDAALQNNFLAASNSTVPNNNILNNTVNTLKNGVNPADLSNGSINVADIGLSGLGNRDNSRNFTSVTSDYNLVSTSNNGDFLGSGKANRRLGGFGGSGGGSRGHKRSESKGSISGKKLQNLMYRESYGGKNKPKGKQNKTLKAFAYPNNPKNGQKPKIKNSNFDDSNPENWANMMPEAQERSNLGALDSSLCLTNRHKGLGSPQIQQEFLNKNRANFIKSKDKAARNLQRSRNLNSIDTTKAYEERNPPQKTQNVGNFFSGNDQSRRRKNTPLGHTSTRSKLNNVLSHHKNLSRDLSKRRIFQNPHNPYMANTHSRTIDDTQNSKKPLSRGLIFHTNDPRSPKNLTNPNKPQNNLNPKIQEKFNKSVDSATYKPSTPSKGPSRHPLSRSRAKNTRAMARTSSNGMLPDSIKFRTKNDIETNFKDFKKNRNPKGYFLNSKFEGEEEKKPRKSNPLCRTFGSPQQLQEQERDVSEEKNALMDRLGQQENLSIQKVVGQGEVIDMENSSKRGGLGGSREENKGSGRLGDRLKGQEGSRGKRGRGGKSNLSRPKNGRRATHGGQNTPVHPSNGRNRPSKSRFNRLDFMSNRHPYTPKNGLKRGDTLKKDHSRSRDMSRRYQPNQNHQNRPKNQKNHSRGKSGSGEPKNKPVYIKSKDILANPTIKKTKRPKASIHHHHHPHNPHLRNQHLRHHQPPALVIQRVTSGRLRPAHLINRLDSHYSSPYQIVRGTHNPGLLTSNSNGRSGQQPQSDALARFTVDSGVNFGKRLSFSSGTKKKEDVLVLDKTSINLLFLIYSKDNLVDKALHFLKNPNNKFNADVNSVGGDGWGAIHYACMNKNSGYLGDLIDCGADVDLRGKGGVTPLFLSLLGNDIDSAEKLVKANANGQLLDNKGNNILYYAVKYKKYKVIPFIYKWFGNSLLSKENKKEIFDLMQDDQRVQAAMQVYNFYSANPEDNEKYTRDLDVFGVLGQGSFGVVYAVRERGTENHFAVKSIPKKSDKYENLWKYTMAEREVLVKANSKFIVKLYETLENEENLFFVLEFCQGGTLRNLLERVKKMSQVQAKFYVCELSLAIKRIHEIGAIYRDLKPSNVALDADGHIKLIDFGLCKQGMNFIDITQTFCGSVAYLAPEMIKQKGHSKSLDWYLLGVIFYELIVGLPPYYSSQPHQFFENIKKGVLMVPKFLTPDARDFLLKLLCRKPEKRLGSVNGWQEIKNHPFLADVDWEKVQNKDLSAPFKPEKTKIQPFGNFAISDLNVKLFIKRTALD